MCPMCESENVEIRFNSCGRGYNYCIDCEEIWLDS